MITALTIIGLVTIYAAVLSTINFLNDKKGGKITDKGVISPSGKDLLEKQKR